MIEVYGDIWFYKADCVVITTNGDINSKGAAVMGKGVALQAKERFSRVEFQIARAIQNQGNHLYMMGDICTFPVKHHWWEKADIELIRRSTSELKRLAKDCSDITFVLVRPGCGSGQLTWSAVLPIVKGLPDNVHIITNEMEEVIMTKAR